MTDTPKLSPEARRAAQIAYNHALTMRHTSIADAVDAAITAYLTAESETNLARTARQSEATNADTPPPSDGLVKTAQFRDPGKSQVPMMVALAKANARIKALEAERDKWKHLDEVHARRAHGYLVRAEAAEARAERYREALKFYADEISYTPTQVNEPTTAVHGDNGKRARTALSEDDE